MIILELQQWQAPATFHVDTFVHSFSNRYSILLLPFDPFSLIITTTTTAKKQKQQKLPTANGNDIVEHFIKTQFKRRKKHLAQNVIFVFLI